MDFGLTNHDDTLRRTNSPPRDNIYNNHDQRGRRRESNNNRGISPPRNSIYGSNSNSNSNDNSSSVFSTMYNPMFELMRMGSRDDQDGRKKSNDEEWATDLRKR